MATQKAKTKQKKPTKKGTSAMATKTTTKAKAKSPAKKAGKLPGFFSFRNKKFIVALVVFVAAAGFGSYQVYQNSAAAAYKGHDTVQGCKNSGVVLRNGSSGSCVRTLQSTLNYVSYLLEGTNWNGLTVDGKFGNGTKAAVQAYQNYYTNETKYGQYRDRLVADGVVGPKTWTALEFSCNFVALKTSRPAPCVARYR